MVDCGKRPSSQPAGDFFLWEHAVKFRSLELPSRFADGLRSWV